MVPRIFSFGACADLACGWWCNQRPQFFSGMQGCCASPASRRGRTWGHTYSNICLSVVIHYIEAFSRPPKPLLDCCLGSFHPSIFDALDLNRRPLTILPLWHVTSLATRICTDWASVSASTVTGLERSLPHGLPEESFVSSNSPISSSSVQLSSP